MRETKIIISIAVVFAAVLLGLAPAENSSKVGGAYVQSLPEFPIAESRSLVLPKKTPDLPRPAIDARSALVKDIGSGLLLYEQAAGERMFIASLTKMMTAVVVDNLSNGDETVVIEQTDTEVAPFTAELRPGEAYQTDDLVAAMLIASSNDAAKALARHFGPGEEAFVFRMNQQARLLGMSESSFSGPVGFDNPRNFSTAEDLTLLIDEFLARKHLAKLTARKEYEFSSLSGRQTHELASTNSLLLADPRVKGIKTGYTAESRGSLAILVDGEHPYYLVVLGSSSREEDAQTLINWIEESVVWK